MKYFKIIPILLYLFSINFSIVKAESLETKKNTDNELEIIAESAVLIDAKTGMVIYDKNMNAKSFPASITKIMTALLTIEYAENNFDERVKMSHDAIFSLPYGSSHIAMNEDETLTIDESLYAIFLASANEVSNAVAEHISGTTEKFAELMTKRAKELGAIDTNFVNPHGLHEENHYTTAKDMALIMKEAIKNKDFVKYLSTRQYKIPPTEKQPNERPLNNSNKMLHPGNFYYYENIVGAKTGFTDEAQHTLVSYAKKDDIELIAVVLKDIKFKNYSDTITLFEYGFSSYKDIEVFNKNNFNKSILIESDKGEIIGQIKTKVLEDLVLNIPVTFNKDKLVLKDTLKTKYNESIKENEVLGKLIIEYENNILKEMSIYADSSFEIPVVLAITDDYVNDISGQGIVNVKYINNLLLYSSLLIILLLCLLFILRLISYKIRKKRRQHNYYIKSEFKTSRRYKYRN